MQCARQSRAACRPACFGYATGRPNLGDDGRYQFDWSRIAFERSVDDDEIDLDSGFLIVPKALPEKTVEPGIVVVGDSVAAEAARFQRDRAAAS